MTFLSLLSILFIALKLTGFIAWSWWWVLSPLWGAPVIIILSALGIVVLNGLSMMGTGKG